MAFNLKKIVSLICSVLLVLSTFAGGFQPIFASAASSGKCGDNLTWAFNESNGNLRINGSGKMTVYESEYSIPWYDFRWDIKSIDFSDSVTFISTYAFSETSITSLTLPKNLETIGIGAFSYCDELEGIIFNSKLKRINSFAFESCESLFEVTIPEGVNFIGSSAFEYCSSLSEISLPDSVEIIDEYAFSETPVIYNLSNWVDGVFYIDNHIISVDISKIPTDFVVKAGIKSIAGGAFDNADIKSLVIADSVVGIGPSAFYGCNNLAEVKMGKSLKTVAQRAFSGCEELKNVVFYPGLEQIGSYAFELCDNLEFVHIPKSVTTLGSSILGGGHKADICAVTTDCSAYEYADESFISFELCDGHGVEELKSEAEKPTEKPEDKPDENGAKYDSRLIKEPSRTSIKYDDAIVLHVDEYFIPYGGKVEWTANNENFSMIVSLDTKTCTIASKVDGETVFTATVYDKNGKAIYTDNQTMDSNADLWQRILGFFRAMFRLDKLYEY